MKEMELKANVLKDMISFFKGKEKDSWAEVLGEGKEDDKEEKKEACDCGKEGCKECGKPKGIAVIEETIMVGKPKK